ncbi:hypothetical protein [Pseudoclavibacter helvolus]|uniref:hypothetical protein n=1 Tax=Pseudoclavibacter helvolus TaxID=255205 RepID=UPI003736ECEA
MRGQAEGYGEAVVHSRVDEEDVEDAELEDEFPDGELHYRIPLDRAEVVDAFTITSDGQRATLGGGVADLRAASFPHAPLSAPGEASSALHLELGGGATARSHP